MIRIKTLHIVEFRGIRELTVHLDGKNFGICGPNGTGKSGVVDAIEFCITGDITRLSGLGTTGLSVKSHAPHVDQRENPEKANVTITAEIPALGKTVEIHRSVRNPKEVEVTPDDGELVGIVKEIEAHPEFALSRREIVKYIITPPGRRSEDVQTLLRLDHIEKLRKNMTTCRNKTKNEADRAEQNYSKAKSDLLKILKLEKLEWPSVIEKVNEKRKILGLPELEEIKSATSLKSDVGMPDDNDDGKKASIRKAVALTDINALINSVSGPEPEALSKARKHVKEVLDKLKADEQALNLARRHGFIKTGLGLVTEDACPLCDAEWNADELRDHLNEKLLSAEEIESELSIAREGMNTIIRYSSERIQSIEKLIHYCDNLYKPISHNKLDQNVDRLKSSETALNNFIKDHSLVSQALDVVSSSWWTLTQKEQECVTECKNSIDALPDTSAEDDARDILSVAQERYEQFVQTRNIAKEQGKLYKIAQKVLDHYNTVTTAVLEGVYDQVAKDFSAFYGEINRDDEEKFTGQLKSEPAKLNFDVDFYGRGLFPPGAYHSEGHQDGMGLCLYLALMKHTLGDKFTFAVLDDVLMSVDRGHRREVCRLLKSKFPNTQFILTTHDRVWLEYMKTEKLIEGALSFAGWTVDSGPRIWDGKDVWQEIQSELGKDNVAGAAWLLRRYLEYTATILADNLRAPTEFRGDSQYDLGDLMPPALKAWRKRLEEGEKCAEHWGRNEIKAALATQRANVRELVAKSYSEQWSINRAVHFNEWENFESHEFKEVVNVFKQLLDNLRCEHCQSYLYILPRKGTPEELRCNCGGTNINLKRGT